MTIRGAAATFCLVSLVCAWGCGKDEASVTESKSAALTDVAAQSTSLAVASKGNVELDLVGTWVLEMKGFEDMFGGLSEEAFADPSEEDEPLEGFGKMMFGMMDMFGGMNDTLVLNADGTFSRTTTMEMASGGGSGSVMEGVWSVNDGWISLYVMRMSMDISGQESKVIEFADATVMPPMAMKLSEDRKTFVDGLSASMDVGGMRAAGISVLYRKQPEDD